MVIFCDHCKVNDQQQSKLFYPNGGEEWAEGDQCPNCGWKLYEADSFEDIP